MPYRILAFACLLSACPQKQAPLPPPHYDAIDRARFNTLAAELALPLFWREDSDKDGALSPTELAVYWTGHSARHAYLDKGGFGAGFNDAYARIVERARKGPELETLPEPERLQREAVIDELAQGQHALISAPLDAADLPFVAAIAETAERVEALRALQSGSAALAAEAATTDPASQALWFRNQGPECVAPRTKKNPACSALGTHRKRLFGLYPAALQNDPTFCARLQREPSDLMGPFTTVEARGKSFVAVPYNVAYKEEMQAVHKGLLTASAALVGEAVLKHYIEAAANAFETNDWFGADEAWAAMNSTNSRWYLRIAPDETYSEPCSQKAIFHVSFGRIDPASVTWRALLDPVKADMEQALAQMSGAQYKTRAVAFHLPDFVQIVLNAGDSRMPSGATIGQSLPNFGPVANENRGRTVAMTGFYTDADSRATHADLAASLLTQESLAFSADDPAPQLMSTVLHEAAHNLGPTHAYKVAGKADNDVFGGPLASMLEELKAQTAAAYFADWLVARKLITDTERKRAHTADVQWMFGHIARGMYDEEGHGKPYAQLAAIELGFLIQEGAVTFDAQGLAANGKDRGALRLHLEKFPEAIAKLMATVAKVKGSGDKKKAEALVKMFVDGEAAKPLHAVIAERLARAPRSVFIYEQSW